MQDDSLEIGDRVRSVGYYDSPSGTILEWVNDSYVRVLWDDVAAPLIHRIDSLIADDDPLPVKDAIAA